MNKQIRTNVDCTIYADAWVTLENPAMTMDQAVAKLEALGNQIVARDDDNRRIQILDSVEHPTEEVWCCEYCGAYSRSKHKMEIHELECMETHNGQLTGE